jgi:assimilatory nitrate reductase catalytic subunit
LFSERFATPNGRARFHPVQHQPSSETPDSDYPLYLTTGRLLAQYQSGTQTRRGPELEKLAPRAIARMHPTAARRYGVEEGDEVTLATRRGSARFTVNLTQLIREDTVFVPFHFGGEQSVNRLTNPALDPISRMPEFKICAVRVEQPSRRKGQSS